MKNKNIISPIFSFVVFCSYSNVPIAAENIPQEIIDFANQNGLILGKSVLPVTNKYPLAGKTINLAGKLSITGKATYQGRNFPFTAPGTNSGIWRTSYIFGQKKPNGTIPFKLNHPKGTFDGVMTPIKPDTYVLKMNNKQGSVLSSLTYYAQQSGTNAWKNTKYSYTATVSKKTVKGVTAQYFEVKELASFKINLLTLPGATANYTYSLDWKGAVK